MLGSWVRAPNGSQVLKIIASLAQLVEHDTLNVGVQGSSPWGSTKGEDLCNPRLFVFMSGIADITRERALGNMAACLHWFPAECFACAGLSMVFDG